MHKRYYSLAIFLTLGINVLSAQFLGVRSGELPPYNNPADLVRDHLTGKGIEILDVQFEGVPQAVGYFTGGNASIGLERGLVMSTGRAATGGTSLGAEEYGSDFANSSNGSTLSDPMLQALSIGPMRDLVRYRITFRASGDSIRFRYVFASEEYPEYSCTTFNDIFGFFLEGPGYPVPVNIARIPGDNMPVAINNVHPYNSQNDPIPNPCFPNNEQFYHDNANSFVQPVYDGYLDVFTAEAAVMPCGVYVMTLALADISDDAFDSAVFLEANSLDGSVDIAASFDPGEAILPENAIADTIFLTFNAIPPTLLPLTVTIGGSAQNGVDYLLIDTIAVVHQTDTVLQFLVQPLTDTLQELIETVMFTVRDTGCFYRSFTVYLADADSSFNQVDSLVISGGSLLLTAPAPTALNNLTWSASNTNVLPVDSLLTMVYSDVTVLPSGPNGGNLSSLATLYDISLLESVCINVEHAWVSDLSVYLFAPNGQFMELSSDNGGNGDDYTHTCFSPSATQPITYGMPFAPSTAAPFTGVFQPEGNWNDLLGAPLSGVWRLGLIDRQNNFQGQLLDWSLSFSGAAIGHFQYLWSTGDTLKTIQVQDPGTYAVTVSNALSAITKSFVVHTPCDTYDSVTVVIAPGKSYVFGNQLLTQPGDYNLTLSASNGCDSIIYLHLEFSTATTTPAAGATISFSPNPSSGTTLISWPGEASFDQVRAFDINGRMVFTEKVAGAVTFQLKTTGWTPGWYTLELDGRNGSRAKGRLLVKN